MPTAIIDDFDLDIQLGAADLRVFPEAATRSPITRSGSREYCCTDNCCTTD